MQVDQWEVCRRSLKRHTTPLPPTPPTRMSRKQRAPHHHSAPAGGSRSPGWSGNSTALLMRRHPCAAVRWQKPMLFSATVDPPSDQRTPRPRRHYLAPHDASASHWPAIRPPCILSAAVPVIGNARPTRLPAGQHPAPPAFGRLDGLRTTRQRARRRRHRRPQRVADGPQQRLVATRRSSSGLAPARQIIIIGSHPAHPDSAAPINRRRWSPRTPTADRRPRSWA